MTEQEIKKLYDSEQPIFQAWGEYIQAEIENNLTQDRNLNSFLKIPTMLRLKTLGSFNY